MSAPDNYVDGIAPRLRQLLPDIIPELAQLYALLVLAKGDATTLEDVHDAWSIWMSLVDPSHPDLVPFAQLTLEQQKRDRPYLHAIHQLSLLRARTGRILTDDGEQIRTRTGRILTQADLDDLAAEAERGYDVEKLRSRRSESE